MKSIAEKAIQRAKGLARLPPQMEQFRAMLGRIEATVSALAKAEAERAESLELGLRRETLTLRAVLHRRWNQERPAFERAPAKMPDAKDYAASLAALKVLAENAYAVWAPLLDVNQDAYHGAPHENCSVEGHDLAELFGLFLAAHLRGAVLDVGCGPQEVPVYLRNYPVERIAGLDPLPPKTRHPFQFHRGVAEFLPWPNRAFDCVIAATSLDHVLVLDRALAEIARVLSDDGTFVLWVGWVPGAAKYDPFSPNVGKVDAFHLFHFDRGWLEEELMKRFRIEESFGFRAPVNSHFYALHPI